MIFFILIPKDHNFINCKTIFKKKSYFFDDFCKIVIFGWIFLL